VKRDAARVKTRLREAEERRGQVEAGQHNTTLVAAQHGGCSSQILTAARSTPTCTRLVLRCTAKRSGGRGGPEPTRPFSIMNARCGRIQRGWSAYASRTGRWRCRTADGPSSLGFDPTERWHEATTSIRGGRARRRTRARAQRHWQIISNN
jgi:hypothetical protein